VKPIKFLFFEDIFLDLRKRFLQSDISWKTVFRFIFSPEKRLKLLLI